MVLLLRKTRVLALIGLCLLLIAPSSIRAELSIDADFDSGSIGANTIDGNDINFVLNTDGLGYTYWTNFKVSGVLNQEVTFEITNADDVPFLSDTGHESQMVYSYDGENWGRLTNHSYASGTYTITQVFTQDEVQIATFCPFSYEKMDAYVDDVNSSEWVTKTVLGQSKEGRDIDLLTITNTGIPVGDKKLIYIIGRQHAAETSSSHMLEGMIDFLISDDVWAEGFRDNYVWYIVPMVNPDGVYLGNSRADSTGIDLNRDWGNSDSVEINLVRNDIESVDTTYGIDMFIDWHSQMNDDGWYNFIYSPTGNTFFSILSAWTDFDSESASGASSCTVDSCTARGYIMTYILFDPTFVFEPTPHLASWSEDCLQQQGEFVAYAINQYFGLYEIEQPSVLLADPSFEASVEDADLRTDTPCEQDWHESRAANPTRLTLDTSTIGGNSGKKAALKYYGIGGSSYVYLTQEFKQPQSGTFDVSLEIYIDNILNEDDIDRTGYIYIGDDNGGGNGPCSTSSERFVFLTFYDPDPDSNDNDLEIRAREENHPTQSWAETDEWTQVASGLSYDTWYTITIDVNVAGGTYVVYVDGVDVLGGDNISKYEDYDREYVTHISFSCGTACSAANLDGLNPVNFKDFAILASDWAETGWDISGDIDKSRVIDFNDLNRLTQHWLDDCGQ